MKRQASIVSLALGLIVGMLLVSCGGESGGNEVSPSPTSSACSSWTYSEWSDCSLNGLQTRTVISSAPSGCIGGSPIISQGCTPPTASTCSFWTYSDWGTCTAAGIQTRNVATAFPAACVGGNPVLQQSCGSQFTPSCTSWTYSDWNACSINGQQTRTISAASPTGCSGGVPVLSQTCTPVISVCDSWLYSDWSACSANGLRTRSVSASVPNGCVGGSPILAEACTPPAQTCSAWTYSDWGVCSSSGQQSRMVVTSLPSGCLDGSPVISQSCTPVPALSALYTEGNKIKKIVDRSVIVLKGIAMVDPEMIAVNRAGLSVGKFLDFFKSNYSEVNTIRLTVYPTANEGERTNGYFADPVGYTDNYLKPVIDECRQRGYYVIIDLHYVYDQADYDANLRDTYVIPFWTKMAMLYKDMPNVLFEIFNEPKNPDDWNTWVSVMAQPVVNAIRAIAPSNIVIVGGPFWDQHLSGALANPVVGGNIAYAIHVYPQQSANWESNYGAIADAYPVFVTEWGYDPYGNNPTVGDTVTFGQPFMSWMHYRGLSWSVFIGDTNWMPKMLVNNGGNLVESVQDVNKVIKNFVPTPPSVNYNYALTHCKDSQQFYTGFSSNCKASTSASAQKLTDVLDCLGVNYGAGDRVVKLTLDFDFKSSAGTCFHGPYLSVLQGSLSGASLSSTATYGCQDNLSLSAVDLILSQAADLSSLYVFGFTGDWCSSFSIKKLQLQ